MWRSGESEKAVWRASLENPMTGRHQGFTGLQSLFAFLETLTTAELPQQSAESDIENRSDEERS